MTKCVIYTRTSSHTAGKKGATIEGQLNRLREYAAREGYEVVREYAETSSAKWNERKKLKQMLRFLRTSTGTNTILIEDATRLCRDRVEGTRLEAALAGITIVQAEASKKLRASPPEVPQGYFYNPETRQTEPHPISAKRVKRLFERCAAGRQFSDTLSARISQGMRAAGRRRTAKRLKPGDLRVRTPRGKEG